MTVYLDHLCIPPIEGPKAEIAVLPECCHRQVAVVDALEQCIDRGRLEESMVLGGAEGQASDVERQVDYMFKLKKRLIKIISQHTGKSEDQVRLDSDRDYYMSASEAKSYGLVDEVIKSRKEVKLLDGASSPSLDRAAAVAEAALPRKVGE